MIVLSPEEMRRLDERAIQEFGIPGAVLMESAGTAAALVARSLLGGRLADASVVVVCGGGNNGGDGLVVARHLAGRVGRVEVFLTVEPELLKGEAAENWRLLEAIASGAPGVSCSVLGGAWTRFAAALERCDLIVDAIFGTGFRGEPEGVARKAIGAINAVSGGYEASRAEGTSGGLRANGRSRRPLVLALDIPSGVDGATGRAAAASPSEANGLRAGRAWLPVAADVTVTFGHLKTGLVQYPGAELAGDVYVADIGLPTGGASAAADLVTSRLVRRLLPSRPMDSNKGTYGRVLIVAGRAGMAGAAAFAGRAALRAGAGLVTLAIPSGVQPVVAGLLPEALSLGLGNSEDGGLGPEAWGSLERRLAGFDALAVGPGLGVGDDVQRLVRDVGTAAAALGKKLVLDADALNAVSRDREAAAEELRRVGPENLVMTPHPGEMARLLGVSGGVGGTGPDGVARVQDDRVRAAREVAAFYGATVVLKGAGTVVAAPDGRVALVVTGNPALAVGGTGDVLTGVVVALLGQGLTAWDAAVAGAFWHGFAGELWAAGHGPSGLLASELADLLPNAREAIISGANPPGWRWYALSLATLGCALEGGFPEVRGHGI